MTWWQVALITLAVPAAVKLVGIGLAKLTWRAAQRRGLCMSCLKRKATTELSDGSANACDPCLARLWPSEWMREKGFESGRLRRIETTKADPNA